MHLAPHPHQFETPQSAGPVSFVSHFRHHPVDPHTDAGASRGLHSSPTLLTHPTNTEIHPQPIQHTYYTETSRPILTPSTPSHNVSPRFSHTSVKSQASFVPTDRSLPSRDVSDNNIDESYALFILY